MSKTALNGALAKAVGAGTINQIRPYKYVQSYAELESTPQIRTLMADHILNIQEAVTQAKAQLRSVLSKI